MTQRTSSEYDLDEDGHYIWHTRRDVPIPEWEGNWMSRTPHDMTGALIRPGDWVVKSETAGRATNLEIRQVREIRPVANRGEHSGSYDGDRVYLGDSKNPVDFPGRLLVIPWDPERGRMADASGVDPG